MEKTGLQIGIVCRNAHQTLSHIPGTTTGTIPQQFHGLDGFSVRPNLHPQLRTTKPPSKRRDQRILIALGRRPKAPGGSPERTARIRKAPGGSPEVIGCFGQAAKGFGKDGGHAQVGQLLLELTS
jgi:hypothetical protein